MGLRSQHLSGFRNVTLAITGGPYPVDFIGAVKAFVERTEAENSLTTLADIGASGAEVKVALTGNTPYTVYACDVFVDISAATYNIEFLEAAPNVATNTNLP